MDEIRSLNQRIAILEALLVAQDAELVAVTTGYVCGDSGRHYNESFWLESKPPLPRGAKLYAGRPPAAEQAEAATKIADLTKRLAECEGALECCGHPIEQAEALKDAARYRWLRENTGEISTSSFEDVTFFGPVGNQSDAEQLDSLIDAAPHPDEWKP
jgi:hypothetical protein